MYHNPLNLIHVSTGESKYYIIYSTLGMTYFIVQNITVKYIHKMHIIHVSHPIKIPELRLLLLHVVPSLADSFLSDLSSNSNLSQLLIF